MENKKTILETLTDSRIIFINGEINSETSNSVIAQLLYLDSISHDDIYIYLNTPGGSVSDGLAIIDTMKFVKSKINTIAIGTAASMGAVILACGDKRYCLKHSKMMIHQVYFGVQGTMSDVSIVYDNVIDTKNSLMKLLSEATKQPVKKLEKDCDRDYWLNAEDALKYGLIDEIFEDSRKDD